MKAPAEAQARAGLRPSPPSSLLLSPQQVKFDSRIQFAASRHPLLQSEKIEEEGVKKVVPANDTVVCLVNVPVPWYSRQDRIN